MTKSGTGVEPAKRCADGDAGVRWCARSRHHEHVVEAAAGASGQVTLFDGRTGEQFDRQVTVGYIYMLKLHHLVDDKIHARSIGPYSLLRSSRWVVRRSLVDSGSVKWKSGLSKHMALLIRFRKCLTVKSDDVSGRTKVYEAIVRGDDTFEAGSLNPSTCWSRNSIPRSER